ncbi:MAG TPA: M48 family metallopeptidase [Candidatus Krumholzibacteria bacterium]|nr:M48 family metallopeptidase [Candidatus Krumholzibacteria bacterium]
MTTRGRWIHSTLIALLAIVAVIACSTVPLTGRKQLNLIPDSEILSMSAQQYDQVLQESKLSTDAEKTAMIRRVGKRIQGAVEQYMRDTNNTHQLDGYKWEFNLIESDEVNAWCMPGGKVVFYTGILPVCKDDAGIAVVMGHEVAHAVAKHGSERMSQGLMAEMGGMALSAALASEPEQTQQLAMTAFGVGAQFGALLPFSRQQESEADHLGLVFMAMAGYDPHVAVPFWERMAAGGGGKPPEIMSTHPSDATRIANLKSLMPEAMKYYKPMGQ